MVCDGCDKIQGCKWKCEEASSVTGFWKGAIITYAGKECPYRWKDRKAEDMTHEQAIEAVRALRRVVAERITEPVKENNENTNEWEAVYKKPPLGCKPSWLASEDRIRELSEAVTRNIESPHKDIKEIRKWAKEILYHCEIMENC